MAKNNVFPWTRSRSLPVVDGTVSGSPVIVGALIGVALTDKATTTNPGGGNVLGEATVALDGAWDVPVTTTTPLTVGAPVYIIAATGVLTPVLTGNVVFGYALEAKGAAAATIRVELSQV